MLDFRPQEDNVAELVIGGSITAADYDRIRPTFEAFVAEHGTVRLLLELRELEDVGVRAVLEDLKLTTEHLRDFERIAVVTDRDWQGTLSKMFGALMPAEVERFELSERGEAADWLRGDGA